MKTNLFLLSLSLFCLSALSQDVMPDINPDDNIVVQFNEALLQAIQNSKFDSAPSTRAAALLNTAMYNAWVPYDSKALPSQVTTFTRLPAENATNDNKKEAAAYAGYYVLTELLPSEKALFDQVMANNNFDTSNIPTDTNTAAGLGNAAGKDLMALRVDDNSNQLGDLNPSGGPYSEPTLLPGYTPYEAINTVDQLNDISHWQPQMNADGTPQTFLTPHWGLVTPFALANGSQFPSEGPFTNQTDPVEFIQQAWNVYNISKTLTDEEKLIASYWAGANNITNPIAFLRVALDVSRRDKQILDEDIQMFMMVANAISDAHIASFAVKRNYTSVRPITVIHNAIDPNWEPYLTANLPEYTSAHSATGAAPAYVLQRFKNSNVYNGNYTDPDTGITLSWPNFSEAADEMAYSRLYAGAHFDRGDLDGRNLGRQVGAAVWEKAQNLTQGISS